MAGEYCGDCEYCNWIKLSDKPYSNDNYILHCILVKEAIREVTSLNGRDKNLFGAPLKDCPLQ